MSAFEQIEEPSIPSSRKVLIAEDSTVIQDLLRLMLTGRGHEVTFCEDGLSALNTLLETEFDVALLDYRLPVLTGLEAARKLFEERSGKPVPRLFAMTSNPESFLEEPDAGDLFEQILPKPIDIDKVIESLDDPESVSKPRNGHTKNRRNDSRKSYRAYGHLEKNIFNFPLDFHGDVKSQSVATRINLYGPPHALVVTNVGSEQELDDIFSLSQLQTTPIIDLSKKLGKRADLFAQRDIPLDKEVLEIIETFSDRRSRIFPPHLTSKELGMQLLIRIYASGGFLNVEYDGTHQGGTVYNTLLSPSKVANTANKLLEEGLLTHSFFDRVHYCNNCKSSRMSVREECIQCQSTQLTETQYLHHFKCAFQAGENEFRVGNELICPKCRQKLRHFGQDYDKPGNMLVCESCSFANNEAQISFLCFDCGTRHLADNTPVRDVYRYELTDKAVALINNGSGEEARLSKSLSFAHLPLEMVAAVNKCAKAYLENGTDFNLVDIQYTNHHALERDQGNRITGLAHENLFERLVQIIPNIEASARGLTNDYFLFQGIEKDNIEDQINSAIDQGQQSNTIKFETKLYLFGPNELY